MKHPKYQVMDNARQSYIPRAFEKYFSDDGNLELVVIEPTSNEPVAGPKPRPTYRITKKTNNKVIAEFHPNGYAELFDKGYQQKFDVMIQKLETKAQQAILDYEQDFGKE